MADSTHNTASSVDTAHRDQKQAADSQWGSSTADLDADTAQQVVQELLETRMVHPVADQHTLRHEPTGAVFTSPHQLAVFHAGWAAAEASGKNPS